MRLIIIGNGFDLAHGLPTSFSDFKKSLIKNKKYLEFVKEIDEIFLANNYDKNKDYDWNQIEELLGKEYKRIKPLNSQPEIDKLEEILEDFSQYFCEYIKNNVLDRIDNIEKKATIKAILSERPDDTYILNFNFTDLYKRYVQIPPSRVFDIHGDIDVDKNEGIVIGYFFSENIVSITDDWKLRYGNNVVCKSYQNWKNRGLDLKQQISSFLVNTADRIDEIVIIGYSFGKSDKHIFNILERALKEPVKQERVSYKTYEKIAKIKIKIFEYKNDGPQKLELFENGLKSKNVMMKVGVIPIGSFKPKFEPIFEIEYLKYED